MSSLSKNDLLMAHMFLKEPEFLETQITRLPTVLSVDSQPPEFLKSGALVNEAIQKSKSVSESSNSVQSAPKVAEKTTKEKSPEGKWFIRFENKEEGPMSLFSAITTVMRQGSKIYLLVNKQTKNAISHDFLFQKLSEFSVNFEKQIQDFDKTKNQAQESSHSLSEENSQDPPSAQPAKKPAPPQVAPPQPKTMVLPNTSATDSSRNQKNPYISNVNYYSPYDELNAVQSEEYTEIMKVRSELRPAQAQKGKPQLSRPSLQPQSTPFDPPHFAEDNFDFSEHPMNPKKAPKQPPAQFQPQYQMPPPLPPQYNPYQNQPQPYPQMPPQAKPQPRPQAYQGPPMAQNYMPQKNIPPGKKEWRPFEDWEEKQMFDDAEFFQGRPAENFQKSGRFGYTKQEKSWEQWENSQETGKGYGKWPEEEPRGYYPEERLPKAGPPRPPQRMEPRFSGPDSRMYEGKDKTNPYVNSHFEMTYSSYQNPADQFSEQNLSRDAKEGNAIRKPKTKPMMQIPKDSGSAKTKGISK